MSDLETTDDILQFFTDKGFKVTLVEHKGEIHATFTNSSMHCSYGTSAMTARDAILKGYQQGVESFGSFTRAEVEDYYRQAFEKATGRSHREVFGW